MDTSAAWPEPEPGSDTALARSQAARRRRVLDAAMRLAARGGFEAVQMRDVATEANVALGTVYRYFTSKERLLLEAMVEQIETLGRRLESKPPQGHTAVARVADVLSRATASLQRHPEVTAAMVRAFGSAQPEHADIVRRVSEAMTGIITGAMHEGVPAPRDLAVARVLQQVFLIEEKRDNWLRVLLPERPNGSRGWVRASEVDVVQNPYHIEISIGAHRITVFNSTMLLYQGPVATGAPGTPTPSGRYYIRVLLQTTDPRSVYGPYAYGLSAHSDVLTAFNGGDAEVGIHGNNDASVLGRDVTHGCVRMDNDEITALSKLLPLGTPVDIKP
jgi:AcrR family transcriptional regulator